MSSPVIYRGFFFSLVVLCATEVSVRADSWTTYRGNPGRSGNTDGKPGPESPKVLWVFKTTDHFVASPVPSGNRLYVSGLGAFNASSFYSLAIDPKAAQRKIWRKSLPELKLPTVSSPAVAEGKLVFGDGMHQINGAVLHCLRADGGLSLWDLPIWGPLVHVEGSPTVVDGRVFVGGGAAGVLCLHLNRVTLEGKENDPATIAKVLDEKFNALLAKYEVDKKTDEFAVPPTRDQLPKPAPVRAWQVGMERWHVDAPVTVAGDRVLVASAYLDKEKVGERALYCLDAKRGNVRWRTPLKINPWGGASVSGNVAVVSGSTIGYDLKVVKQAKGEVAAFGLADGKLKWRNEVPTGGVLGCVALGEGIAVATATDGKIRAFDLATGQRRWVYEGKDPFFAPPALAGGMVYAGDLKGVIHAINLANGRPKWTLDLGLAPQVKAPGMIYGGPVVQGGRVFVATNNLEGPFAGRPTVVVCIGQ
jgi:outer membrane protein assembly factor BamB